MALRSSARCSPWRRKDALVREEWSRKSATLSDKTARKEFGLTHDEIVAPLCPWCKW